MINGQSEEKVSDGNGSGRKVEFNGDGESSLSIVNDFSCGNQLEKMEKGKDTASMITSSFMALAKEATSKATITAAVASKTVHLFQNFILENTGLGELQREQAKFCEHIKNGKLEPESVPWSDLPDEAIAMKQILSLSLDSRNFLRDLPVGVKFDSRRMQGVAAKMLSVDPNLEALRYQLVPKRISEEKFWLNYIYRISLVRQSIMKENNVIDGDPLYTRESYDCNQVQEDGAAEANLKDEVVVVVIEDASKKSEISKKENVKPVLSSKEDEWVEEIEKELAEYQLIGHQIDPKAVAEMEKEIADIIESLSDSN